MARHHSGHYLGALAREESGEPKFPTQASTTMIRQSPFIRRLTFPRRVSRHRLASIRPATIGAERISRLGRPCRSPNMPHKDPVNQTAGVKV